MTSSTRRPLTYLGSGNSTLCRVFDELGGPAALGDRLGGPGSIGDDLHRTIFERACNDFSFERVKPTIQRWTSSAENQLRHWPWIAIAASQYAFERERRSTLPSGPKPSEFEDTLRSVQRNAKTLSDALVALMRWRYAPNSPSAPLRNAHIAWVQEFLMQNAVLSARSDNDLSDKAELDAYMLGQEFIKKLINLSLAAEAALGRLDKELIGRTRSACDDSLYNLVSWSGEIWTSLTGRQPSVNKVDGKGRQDRRPDFVLFVCEIALLASRPEPTFDQVASAYTRYCENKSPE